MKNQLPLSDGGSEESVMSAEVRCSSSIVFEFSVLTLIRVYRCIGYKLDESIFLIFYFEVVL